jgi:hypothetical protein
VAVVRSDPPQIFLASDEDVLSRLVALRVVARSDPRELPEGSVERIREALLEERWGDAVSEWIGANGEAVDGYPDEDVWTEARLDAETASLEIRLERIFEPYPRRDRPAAPGT